MIFLTSLFTLKKRKCGVIGFYLGDNGVSDNLPSVFFFKLAIKIETYKNLNKNYLQSWAQFNFI